MRRPSGLSARRVTQVARRPNAAPAIRAFISAPPTGRRAAGRARAARGRAWTGAAATRRARAVRSGHRLILRTKIAAAARMTTPRMRSVSVEGSCSSVNELSISASRTTPPSVPSSVPRPPEQRRPADHHDGDRRQLEPLARGRRADGRARGQHDARAGGQRAADHVGPDQRARDGDAVGARGVGIAADRVDVAPERRPAQQPADDGDRHRERGQRDRQRPDALEREVRQRRGHLPLRRRGDHERDPLQQVEGGERDDERRPGRRVR